jgi:hypothetical protein
MRNAQIIDLETYRARRAPVPEPSAPASQAMLNPFAALPIMWVPIWYWVPVNLIFG